MSRLRSLATLSALSAAAAQSWTLADTYNTVVDGNTTIGLMNDTTVPGGPVCRRLNMAKFPGVANGTAQTLSLTVIPSAFTELCRINVCLMNFVGATQNGLCYDGTFLDVASADPNEWVDLDVTTRNWNIIQDHEYYFTIRTSSHTLVNISSNSSSSVGNGGGPSSGGTSGGFVQTQIPCTIELPWGVGPAPYTRWAAVSAHGPNNVLCESVTSWTAGPATTGGSAGTSTTGSPQGWVRDGGTILFSLTGGSPSPSPSHSGTPTSSRTPTASGSTGASGSQTSSPRPSVSTIAGASATSTAGAAASASASTAVTATRSPAAASSTPTATPTILPSPSATPSSTPASPTPSMTVSVTGTGTPSTTTTPSPTPTTSSTITTSATPSQTASKSVGASSGAVDNSGNNHLGDGNGNGGTKDDGLGLGSQIAIGVAACCVVGMMGMAYQMGRVNARLAAVVSSKPPEWGPSGGNTGGTGPSGAVTAPGYPGVPYGQQQVQLPQYQVSYGYAPQQQQYYGQYDPVVLQQQGQTRPGNSTRSLLRATSVGSVRVANPLASMPPPPQQQLDPRTNADDAEEEVASSFDARSEAREATVVSFHPRPARA